MRRLLLSLSLLTLATATTVFAQPPAAAIDPVKVSPDMYRVVLENEHVRVVEYEIRPGQRDNWHTHPAKVSYILSGGSLKITTEQGESFIVEEQQGEATWFGEVGRHYGENVGTTPVRILLVEIKRVDAEKDNLERFK